MKADRVEISRDQSTGWLIRIQVGEEVIRRHSGEPKDASEAALRAVAVKTANDEGYTIDPSDIVLA